MSEGRALSAVLLLLSAAVLAAPEVQIASDFGAATQPILGRGGRPNENVTGVMVGEWRDDSAWAPDVHATWTRLEEEGRGFVRLDLMDVGDHWYQLAHALPDVTEESFFRLTLTARSTPGHSLTIGIRDSGQPYRFHWEAPVVLKAEWRDYDYDFRLDRLDAPVGLWIVVRQAGQLDLARLQLVRLTRADYIEELKAKYGDRGPANLVNISRFPLGLQSGWALGRDNSDGDDVQIEPDPQTPGPSGAPALRITTEEPTVLVSAPFGVPLGFQPHVASLYAKGTGELRISVFCDGRQIASQATALTGGEEWQRAQVTFEPNLMARGYSLRIQNDQTFWMDALQVEPGKEPTAYRSQLPCEVSLACPPSDAAVARVQFDDEPARVSYCVTGQADGARLCCRIVNVYGEAKDLDPVPLAVLPATGSLAHDVFPARPFGPIRVEAWVEDAQGQRISTYNELVVYRLPRPRYWGKDAPDSPFGVHTNSTTRHNLMLKAVGANWTRLHDAGLQYLGWWWLEREPGKWTFHDKELHRFRRDHVKILGELGTAPEWASYYPGKAHSGYFDRYYQPRRMEDYANYVRTVCERYRGVLDAYDVWNEPWIYSWWAVGYDETKPERGYVTSERPQEDFVRLMRTAFETAKAVDPGITILGVNSTTGGGGATSIGGAEWTRGVVEAGGLDFCDVVCYHQYIGGKPGYPGDVVERGFQTATGPIAERFGTLAKPVWMTEGSAARDTIGPGFYRHTLPFDNTEDVAETADRLCRYVVALLAQGVQKLFLYSMHAQHSLDGTSEWRVIVSPEGYLHPSGAAHGILAWHLEDTRFVKSVPVREGVHAYLFEARDGSRSVVALSGMPGHEEYLLPRAPGLEVRDLFGNALDPGAPLGDTMVYLSAKGGASELEALLR